MRSPHFESQSYIWQLSNQQMFYEVFRSVVTLDSFCASQKCFILRHSGYCRLGKKALSFEHWNCWTPCLRKEIFCFIIQLVSVCSQCFSLSLSLSLSHTHTHKHTHSHMCNHAHTLPSTRTHSLFIWCISLQSESFSFVLQSSLSNDVSMQKPTNLSI